MLREASKRAFSQATGRGLAAGLALLVPSVAALTPAGPIIPVALLQAQPAYGRTLSVRDEGRLHFREADATAIFDEGRLAGTIPGEARVDFRYNGSPTVSASFAIHGSGGSLYGHARCRLSSPTNPTPSFRGILQITGGNGRFAHVRGSGELFGVFHRRGYGLVVQAIGRLRY